ASEGRKFGLGLCVVTQRAARIDKNVLSQCNTQLILQVTNPLDLKAITQSLPVGVALITGGGYHTPLFCEVRPRSTRHGGESVQIVAARRPRLDLVLSAGVRNQPRRLR